ncbi:hypothetical protein [Rhizobium vallis]|uniref:hypothetical protein n=1 Tax=Rhizobium vallis TaxID=634290 RepID=UPI0013E0922B|nr:hypothetical protein [Rhizobium vallis]
MILRHRLRHAFHSRPGTPGRGHGPRPQASDIILVMMAGLLVAVAIFKILQG